MKNMIAYEHLLSPLKIGNVTLKNQMLNSKCVSSDEMEPELSGPFYEHLAQLLPLRWLERIGNDAPR